MPLETLNQYTNKVSDLPDKPNTQMTAAELKAQFDAAPEELRVKYNEMVNVLKSSITGDSGAENIGIANISGVAGNTVHGQMKDLFDQLKAVVLGQVPNKSITREKFADGAVDFSPVQKEIANLNLQLAASQLVPSGKTYGWDPTTSFGVIVDFTKGKTTAQLNAGDTSLEGKVTMSEGTFVAGKKVTVLGRNPADDSIVKEQATITSVSPLTISPLVNSYKEGAWIKRTTANNTTNGIVFGGVDDSVINNITDATVVNSAYDTSGNGGRKLVRLSNGWLVSLAIDTTNRVAYFYLSKDNGNTWAQSLSYTGLLSGAHVSMYSHGNFIHVLQVPNTASPYVMQHRPIRISTDGLSLEWFSSWSSVDTGQTAFSGVPSLAINGNYLEAAWASKNSTYPNSFNIRYAKGTINADGSVTWGAVEQWTTFNTSGQDMRNPSIITVNSRPIVIFEHVISSTSYYITAMSPSGMANVPSGSLTKSYSYIQPNTTYAQSTPSAIFVPQEIAIKNTLFANATQGVVATLWHGTDSVDSTRNNVRFSYSLDGGVTWTVQKLTSGNSLDSHFATITANKSGELFALWHGKDSVLSPSSDRIFQMKLSGAWGSKEMVTNVLSQYASSLYDPSFNFESPLFIYKDVANAKVGFCGTWTIGVEAPITENTLRLTLTQQAKEVMTYLHHTASLTATAQVNGNFMDKTTTTEETQFTRVLGSLQDIEIEITLTRSSVDDDITINKILGGVA
ncbi:hypothetical protein [Cytobacillus oceanisediminis]|uniref:hypothetical protein n=1 Tax=Cytobacillus oceanisediminis TaxID=665099 RepID=UPI00373606CA